MTRSRLAPALVLVDVVVVVSVDDNLKASLIMIY